jgi:hypothetical protein
MAMMIPRPTRRLAAASHHNKDKQRPDIEEARESYKRQVYRVQHQLDAHEHRDQCFNITPTTPIVNNTAESARYLKAVESKNRKSEVRD